MPCEEGELFFGISVYTKRLRVHRKRHRVPSFTSSDSAPGNPHEAQPPKYHSPSTKQAKSFFDSESLHFEGLPQKPVTSKRPGSWWVSFCSGSQIDGRPLHRNSLVDDFWLFRPETAWNVCMKWLEYIQTAWDNQVPSRPECSGIKMHSKHSVSLVPGLHVIDLPVLFWHATATASTGCGASM